MKTPMRERLLDAAWSITCSRGLAAMTTRAISQEAGVAEGSIYKHFSDKTDLVLAMVLERAGDVRSIFAALHKEIGKHTVSANLKATLVEMIGFYENVQIVIAGAMSEPETMKKLRQVFSEQNKGPQRAHVAMAAYLDAERDIGRLSDLGSASRVLVACMLGAAHERAFLNLIEGKSMTTRERKMFADEIVEAVIGH